MPKTDLKTAICFLIAAGIYGFVGSGPHRWGAVAIYLLLAVYYFSRFLQGRKRKDK